VKKVFISLVVGLAMVALMAVPALAQALKVELVKADPALAGGGSVVFNGPAGNNQFECELTLKGVAPNTTYTVLLDLPGWGYFGIPLGSITTNAAGNANLHHNCPVSDGYFPPGPCAFGIRVQLAGIDAYSMSATAVLK
jgi:hypothetical protein